MTAQALPVVHVRGKDEALVNVSLAHGLHCDGVFLISHGELDEHGLKAILADSFVQGLRAEGFKVGVNFLGLHPQTAVLLAGAETDMVWTDNARLDDDDVQDGMATIKELGSFKGEYFGGVAFKCQGKPTDLVQEGMKARGKMDVLTTSGDGTGIAPEVSKLARLAEGFGGKVAVASGVTPWNVGPMLPYVSHILVATGIAKDFHNIDAEKCQRMVEAVKAVV